MKNVFSVLFITIVLCARASFAQSDQHYTIFMYNKLLYNPGYAGSRELTSVNASYRDQWNDLPGAPKTFNATIDAPVGRFTKQTRPIAVGLSFSNELLGVEKKTETMAYCAYRIQFSRSVLSMGLRAGAELYSANYDQLNLAQQNDPGFAHNVSNAFLPNFGAGAFWSGKDMNQEDKFYLGFSVPNLLQNYYDENEKKISNVPAKEIRGYYMSGGLVLPLPAEAFKIEPQFILRYAGNSLYHLPVSCDLNLSAIYNGQVMVGATYRTDQSLEFIVHVQVLREVNVGYAYDYLMSPLSTYASGSHELVVGFDVVRKKSKYINPRFTRSF